MMGMTSPFVAGPPPPRAAAKPESAAPPPEPSAPPAARAGSPDLAASTAGATPSAQAGELSTKRTMLGVAPPASVAQAIRAANNPKQTMLGLSSAPSPSPDPSTQPSASASPAPSPSTAAGAPASPVGPPSAPSPAALPEQKIAPKSERTMLGLAVSAPAQARTAGPSAAPPQFSDPPADNAFSSASERPSQRAPTPSRAPASAQPAFRAVLAALAGALSVLAVGLAVWHFASGGSDVAVRVLQSDEGELLEVQVADAQPGDRVRFVGSERELAGGVARFPLASDALSLGDNELTIGVLRGDRVESTKVRLHVAYRARVDTAGLGRKPPVLEVVIEAQPGSKVTVDGEALALDARGRGVKSYPVAAQSGTKLAFTARYRIEPKDGAANDGSLSVNLPVTSLQIDRPGPRVTTDQASIEVAGAVESGAQVTINGQPIKVSEGRFLHRVRLPESTTIHVQALAPGKAPRALDLQVVRVADLTLAAAEFKADPALNYARIAQNPAIYRGQNVSLDGRVYNVEVKGGQSHLQMLARDCPGAQRCPLWVDLAQATDVTVDTWVRVLGTVAGEQQFRSERGQVHTVPSVKAQYVLKLAR
jgi:hypothetical protein